MTLLSVDEDGHVLLLPLLPFCLLSGSEFSFTLCHDEYCSVYRTLFKKHVVLIKARLDLFSRAFLLPADTRQG